MTVDQILWPYADQLRALGYDVFKEGLVVAEHLEAVGRILDIPEERRPTSGGRKEVI